MFRIWHPMRDPHHCCFRILALLTTSQETISIARISLLDTFLLFPEYLHEIRYIGFGELRSKLRALDIPKPKDSFVSLPDIRTVYRELQSFQKAAFHQLVAKELISKEAFSLGKIELFDVNIPEKLQSSLSSYADEQKSKLDFIVRKLGAVPLDGPKGLFRRTNLEIEGRFR